jgi:hypothetical protein
MKYIVLVAKAVVLGVAIFNLVWAFRAPIAGDMEAYWSAALRLREGQPLFPAVAVSDAPGVYQYSPWFAWLWVPLTFLPRELVTVAWLGTLFTASAALARSLWRLRGYALLALLGPILLESSLTGNVHVLLIAGLFYGVERRSGPVWIAVAASLKAAPAVFALVYLGRRDWGRFGSTAALTALLVAPFLLYDLSNFPLDPGPSGHHYGLPLPLVIALVIGGTLLTPVLARTRWAWFVPALTTFFAFPRVHPYNLHVLLIGLAPRRPGPSANEGRR